MESQESTKSLNENERFSASAIRTDALVGKLARFYSVMGNRPDEPGALALMAEILCQSGTDEQIAHAMTRCSRECRYPTRLPDILQRIPGCEVSAIEAEMRAAWDVLIKFVDKWCRWNDGYWDGEKSHVTSARVEEGAPELPQRIVDTVCRTGGWAVYLRMEPRDFPFQQKRFFEEYEAWTAVERERVALNRMLGTTQSKQLLTSTAMVPVKHPDSVKKPTVVSAMDIYTPPTVEQLRDRAAVQKAALEKWIQEHPRVATQPG